MSTLASAPNIALLDHSAGLVSRTVQTPAGELVLSAWKTVYSPQHRALFVADVHLGKAHTFRQLGVPVPQGEMVGTAADAGDIDTSDLFTELSRGADKQLWFVEAHLER